jgi:NAD(P)-dependent dehydrogenase (short-subunit alcohol dehydrogenase family)
MLDTKTNPIALIVGAGDFIGAEIAKRFATEGYTLCLGRRNKEKLSPIVQEIESIGGKAYGFSLDARDEDNVKAVFAEIENTIGPIEIVIFNIGANVSFPIVETTSRVFRKVWEMACYAGFLTGKEAAAYMQPRQKGSIFFTGATASLRGGKGYSAFSSAKFGLRALAQSMARELGPQNIHVAHLVIDAAVETDWVKALIQEKGVNTDSLPDDSLMKPASVANAYWRLHQQQRDAWTFELDLRPFSEQW